MKVITPISEELRSVLNEIDGLETRLLRLKANRKLLLIQQRGPDLALIAKVQLLKSSIVQLENGTRLPFEAYLKGAELAVRVNINYHGKMAK